MPLTPADCPLLTPADQPLLDRFNQVEQLAARLGREYKALAEPLSSSLEALATVRAQLSRAKYRCGFLGLTGAGKSSTFNNILDVTEADAPAKFGTGGATTSVISRLIRATDRRNSLFLNYLTPAEYRAKRDALCDAVGVAPGLSNAEILALLPGLRQKAATGHSEARERDIEALRWLLDSHDAPEIRAAYLKDPGVREPADYDRREELLNHPPPPEQGSAPPPRAPSRLALLREAEIHFATDRIPAELEMIDLPGFGSEGSIDSILTTSFLSELDGALIFLRADLLSDATVEANVKKLKKLFGGRWGKRLWVIATKFDGLTVFHFNDPKSTWFDSVQAFLGRHQVDLANLHVVSNELYWTLRKLSETPTPAERREKAAGLYRRAPDDPLYSRHADRFRVPLTATYFDGGIARLRDLLTHQLADAIRVELKTAAEERLDELARELDKMERLEQRRQRLTKDEFLQARDCRNAVARLQRDLGGRCELLGDWHAKLRAELAIAVERILPADVTAGYEREEIPDESDSAAAALDKMAGEMFVEHVVEPAYQALGERLKPLPKVPLAKSDSPQAAWARFQAEDGQAALWRDLIPRFRDPSVFAELAQAGSSREGFDGRALRDVFVDKARLLTDQAAHAVRMRLKYRLGEIEADLTALVRETDRRE